MGACAIHWTCDCWKIYSYLDRVVLVVVDQRRRLAGANCRAQIDHQRLTAIKNGHAARIRELEENILMEQERTNAFREQLQEVNARLLRL